jgi:hypothetical protein
MNGSRKGLRRLVAGVLAAVTALSFASCALFGTSKEIVDAADNFAATVIKGNTKEIIKLTTEKKSSNAAAELGALLNKNNYSSNQKEFIDAVADTMTYEVKSDTVKSDTERGSVDVVFTMVDYEKAIKDGDCEDIDDVIDALKDCEDTMDITVGLEFKNKGDKWLVDNIDDKDFEDLFEFYTYDIGAEIISDSVDVYGYEYDDIDDTDYFESLYKDYQTQTYGYGPETINLWSFTNEVPDMVAKYIELNPDFGNEYTVVCKIIPTTTDEYQPALEDALINGGSDAPDIYAVEAGFATKFTQGEFSGYAAPYEDLGIDIDAAIEEADIAQYTIDVGTNSSGDIVALAYQSTGGAMIYRRSIAKEVFGTDDPEEISEIVGGGSGSWDAFWDAAAVCADNGVAMVSGDGDIWKAVEGSTDSWIKNGSLNMDSGRFDFFDMSYELTANGWSNGTQDWTEAWYADMAGNGERPVFCYLGPAWLLNYVLALNCGDTYGDWAVCTPPVGFCWGGTWLLANADTDQPEGVAELLYWITLDCTEDGLQYLWANNLFYDYGCSDTVASAAVMAMSDGTSDLLGGQNMFGVYIEANEYATGDNMTEYDTQISSLFRSAVDNYVDPYGDYYGDLDAAIAAFESDVEYNIGI